MRPLRVTAGQYYADIVQDRHDPNLWVYVVQREGSTDILAMGSCTDCQQCTAAARKVLADLSGQTGSGVAAS